METFTTVICAMRDCVYYHPDPASPHRCRCSHPDKPHYMKGLKCPLYRLDWKKQAKTLPPEEKPKRTFPA